MTPKERAAAVKAWERVYPEDPRVRDAALALEHPVLSEEEIDIHRSALWDALREAAEKSRAAIWEAADRNPTANKKVSYFRAASKTPHVKAARAAEEAVHDLYLTLHQLRFAPKEAPTP